MVSSLDLVTAAVAVLTVAVFVYAAYWATSIARVLAVRVYRHHAIGVAIMAIGFALLDVESVFIFDYGVLVVPVIFLTIFPLFVVMFYFIDTAVLAARRADPLLRNTANWRSIRKPIWVVIILAIALAIGTSVAGYSGFGGIFLIPFLLVAASAGIVLPLAARRSKDFVLNRHLRWFAVFAIFSVGWFLLEIVNGAPMNPTSLLSPPLNGGEVYVADLIALVGLSGAGYFLYRSARGLVPLNRMSSADETQVEVAGEAQSSSSVQKTAGS